MDVASIMSPEPVRVDPSLSLEAAADLMLTEDVRHLPVVEREQLVGLVSDRDLYPAEQELGARRPGAEAYRLWSVADVMHTDMTIVAPDDTVVTAAVAFVLRKIGCLPVLQDGELVGILSEMDMLTAYVRLCRRGQLPEPADQPPVAALMTPDPVTAAPGLPVPGARRLLSSLRARHLPVVEGDALVGLVSDRDLRRAEAAGHAERCTLGQIMQRELLTVEPGTRLPDAATLMTTAKISCLPVLSDGQLVGILTLTDLLNHCLGSLREPEGEAHSRAAAR